MKAFTFISIGFSFVFRCKNNHKNIFDRISFVSCNCPFDLSGFSGCWTCFPSEAAAYVKSPPKHMFPFPTIISIENNSFVSKSRPSAQSGLKMKFLSSVKMLSPALPEPLRIRIYPENCESAPKSRSPNCSFWPFRLAAVHRPNTSQRPISVPLAVRTTLSLKIPNLLGIYLDGPWTWMLIFVFKSFCFFHLNWVLNLSLPPLLLFLPNLWKFNPMYPGKCRINLPRRNFLDLFPNFPPRPTFVINLNLNRRCWRRRT